MRSGGRNDALNVAAVKLGNYIAGAGLDQQTVIDALTAASTSNGLLGDDGAASVAATIRSGLRAGKARPRGVPDPPEGATGQPEPPTPDVDDIGADVERKARELRILDEARSLNARRRAQSATPPEFVALGEFLTVPDEALKYRVDRLLPVGGRAILTAQFKAGKSTLTGNLMRCLVDGAAFLDEFTVAPPAGDVVLVDDELDERTLRRWLREQGIVNVHRVHVIALRGRVAEFNLLDPATRTLWARKLAAAHAAVLIFDCLRPVLDALGLSEDKDAGRFLVALDALLDEAGVGEALVAHHMGHNGERARGDSRLRDWPDVEWRIVRQVEPGVDPDPSAPRFFSAFGRDVEVPEGALVFDPANRHLTYAAGNRKQAKATKAAAAALPAVLALLADSPVPLSGNAVELRLKGGDLKQSAIRSACKLGIDQGDILTEDGDRRAKLHFLNPTRSSSVRCSSLPLPATNNFQFVSSSNKDELELDTNNDPPGPLDGNELEPDDGRPGTCTVCAEPLLLRMTGRTVCARTDEQHAAARAAAVDPS